MSTTGRLRILAESAMQEQLRLLNLITDELNSDLDPDNMLQRVLNLTVRHLGAAEGSILLFDEQQRVTDHILMRRDLTEAAQSHVVGRVLAEGFAGWVVAHKQGDIIYDTHQDPRWFTFPDQPYDHRSAIACPLRRRERVLGVLTLVHPDPHFFRSEQLSLLMAIAGQSAIALENAQLFKQTEAERTRLWAILNSTQDAVIATSPSDHLLMLNPAAKAAFEIRDDTWANRPLTEVIHNQSLVHLWTPSPPMVGEIPLTDGRTLWASVTEVPSVGRVAVLRDITQFKALDKAKSEIITTFTHDLGAPLAVVKGYVELIKMDGSLNQQQMHDLAGIVQAADQMKAIIEDLLELGQIEAIEDLRTHTFEISDVVETTVASFNALAEVNTVGLILEPCDQHLTVRGNPSLLARALDNLVENAIKYTPPGGRVTVSTYCQQREVIVSVADNGPGISEQDLPRVFEKFFRARKHQDHTGTGLGLAIVRSIVERHRGRVWAEIQPNQGSTFSIALPMVGDPVDRLAEVAMIMDDREQ
jgi:two-component system phosphate regulon sensor histidine kinase PhoR